MNPPLASWSASLSQSVDPEELLVLVRVVIAACLGAILGWERESQGKAAGLRTHILVAIAAALYSGVSLMLARHYGDNSDALRAVPAIATGIGFLGAGLIFVNRHKRQVHGLTTAASVWATAALGMTAGFGYWVLALGAGTLVLFTLRMLTWATPESPDHE